MDPKDIQAAAEDAMNTVVTKEDMLSITQGSQILRKVGKFHRGEQTRRTEEEVEGDMMQEQLITDVVGLTLRQAGKKLRSLLRGTYMGGIPGAVAADVRGDINEVLAELASMVVTRLEKTDPRFAADKDDSLILHKIDERLQSNEDN